MKTHFRGLFRWDWWRFVQEPALGTSWFAEQHTDSFFSSSLRRKGVDGDGKGVVMSVHIPFVWKVVGNSS